MKDFSQLAKERYSVRKMTAKEIPQEDVEKILQAGICAPTAVNNQPIHIWAVESEQAREQLLTCTKMQFIAPAKLILIIGAKPSEAWVRPFDGKNYAEIDAAIVTTQMMLQIHDLGYGSTWIGHFDAEKVKAIFPETAEYELVALLPVGGIAQGCEPSPRHLQTRPREELITVL